MELFARSADSSYEITITFAPAVPCGTISTDGVSRCNKEATVGTLYPMGGGQYMIRPICRDCTLAMKRIYLPDAERDK